MQLGTFGILRADCRICSRNHASGHLAPAAQAARTCLRHVPRRPLVLARQLLLHPVQRAAAAVGALPHKAVHCGCSGAALGLVSQRAVGLLEAPVARALLLCGRTVWWDGTVVWPHSDNMQRQAIGQASVLRRKLGRVLPSPQPAQAPCRLPTRQRRQLQVCNGGGQPVAHGHQAGQLHGPLHHQLGVCRGAEGSAWSSGVQPSGRIYMQTSANQARPACWRLLTP